jgi:hypothetical protein
MKNLQNHFSHTKFHCCRSNFTSKKKTDLLLAYSHLKNSRNNNSIWLIRRSKEQSRNLKSIFEAFQKVIRDAATFSDWIDKVDFGFCTSAPSHFGQMQDLPGYQALQGLLRLYLLLPTGKKTNFLFKRRLQIILCLFAPLSQRHINTHTQKSSALQF